MAVLASFNSWIRAGLCVSLVKLGAPSRAQRIGLLQAEPTDRTPAFLCRLQAAAWLAQKNPWKAVPHLRQLFRRRAFWPKSCWAFTDALIQSGAGDEALEILRGLEPELQNTVPWTLQHARALQKLGRIEAAITALETAPGRLGSGKVARSRIKNLRAAQAVVVETRRQFQASPTWASLQSLRNRHAGKRCFIIGNGPSLLKQDLSLLSNEITFATNWFVNHPDCLRINPTYYCVCSHTMFGGWEAGASTAMNPDFRKLLLANAPQSHKIFSYKFAGSIGEDAAFSGHKIDYLLFDNPKKKINCEKAMSTDLSSYMYNGYTVILTFCIPLAFHMGFSEIYLIGCDCDYQLTAADQPKAHFYHHALHTTQSTKFENLCREWADGGPVFQCYAVAAREAEARGVRIFNATAGGRLEVFPRRDYSALFPAPAALPS